MTIFIPNNPFGTNVYLFNIYTTFVLVNIFLEYIT